MGDVGQALELVGQRAHQLEAARAGYESVRKARAALDEAVMEARLRGATYGEIGQVLGVTRQRVQQKWGPSGTRFRVWMRKAGGAPPGAPAFS